MHGQRALVCGGWGGVAGTEWYSGWTLVEWYGWPNGSKAAEFCCRGLEYCQESLNSLQTNKTKLLKKLLIDNNVNFCDLSFFLFLISPLLMGEMWREGLLGKAVERAFELRQAPNDSRCAWKTKRKISDSSMWGSSGRGIR